MLVSDENEAGPSVGSQPREWSACADSFGTDGCRRPQCFIVLQSREEDLAPLHGLQESSLFAVALAIVSDCVRVLLGARLGVRDARRDEAGATIYDRVPLRKWVL